MRNVRLEGFSPHRSVTGIILISSSFGLLWPLFSLFQFPAVLRWLEPTSAYLKVYYVDAG